MENVSVEFEILMHVCDGSFLPGEIRKNPQSSQVFRHLRDERPSRTSLFFVLVVFEDLDLVPGNLS